MTVGPETLLPVNCPRCGAEIGRVRAWTETEFYLTSDGKEDTGRVSIEVKVQRRDQTRAAYAGSSTSLDHVCDSILTPPVQP